VTRIFDASGTTRPVNWRVTRSVTDRTGATSTPVATYVNSKGLLQRAAYGKERINYRSDGSLRGLLIEPSATNYIDGNYNVNGKGTMGSHNATDPFGTNYGNLLGPGKTDYEFLNYDAGTYEFAIYFILTTGIGQIVQYGDDRTANYVQYNVDSGVFTYSGNANTGVLTTAPNGFNKISFYATQPAKNSSISIINVAGTANLIWSMASAQLPGDINNRQTLIICDGSTYPVTRGADTATFNLASDATSLIFTFEDNSTQTISNLTPGSLYTIPINLPKTHILYIDDNSVKGDGVYVPPAGRPGTPMDISAKPLYYFDPSQSATITYDSANKILSRKDISGNNVIASCPDSDTTHRPVIAAGAIGGLDAIQYKGSSGWDRCSVSVTTKTVTAFVVAQPQSAGGYSRFMSFGPSGGGADYNNISSFDVEQNGGGGKIYLQRNGTITTTVAFSNNTPGIVEVVFDGTKGYLYFNGSLVGSIAATAVFNIINSTFGQSATQGDSFNGLQGTQMLYNVNLSDADRAWVRGCLAWQWDGGNAGTLVALLPSTDPYKNVAPFIVQSQRRRLARFFCS
jgi:hypothetical protein